MGQMDLGAPREMKRIDEPIIDVDSTDFSHLEVETAVESETPHDCPSDFAKAPSPQLGQVPGERCGTYKKHCGCEGPSRKRPQG